MKEFGAFITSFLLVMAIVFGLTWLAEGNNFFIYKYFAPKQAAVERQVFEQTKSYNDGMAQELQNLRLQFMQTDDIKQKNLIKSIVAHRTAGYDVDNLNDPGLRAFVLECRGF